MNKIIDTKAFLLVYPCILVQGALVNLIAGASRLEHQRDTYYILSSKNWINQIFAYRGNLIWTILYVALASFQIHMRVSRSGALPLDARSSRRDSLMRTVKPYLVKLALKNLALTLVFLIIDRTFIWTGGSCSISDTKSAEVCRHQGGNWENGFDISGHFCFLTTVSLVLWLELSASQKYMSINDIVSSRSWHFLRASVVFVLVTWAFVLSVTAIYYHTFLEKVLGLAMGYICPGIMYWAIPAHQKLSSLLY
ncbi:LANO_0G16930g1_1 [Lachancea nothofagi CBS 11611]|uniref:LANO_0G16930g1_1 n=1 Tax=Lachancea nothofagi CBS 11611 TaxID=1266666 RepID=A0A1G4KKD4_9SACH|nr:LANO_0G16930g1_1 [Lachancea nothofagi CBS 11611]